MISFVQTTKLKIILPVCCDLHVKCCHLILKMYLFTFKCFHIILAFLLPIAVAWVDGGSGSEFSSRSHLGSTICRLHSLDFLSSHYSICSLYFPFV